MESPGLLVQGLSQRPEQTSSGEVFLPTVQKRDTNEAMHHRVRSFTGGIMPNAQIEGVLDGNLAEGMKAAAGGRADDMRHK